MSNANGSAHKTVVLMEVQDLEAAFGFAVFKLFVIVKRVLT